MSRGPGSAAMQQPSGDGLMGALGFGLPPLAQVRAIIQRALEEDVSWGDVTTDNSVPPDQRSRAVLLAKQQGVLCGGPVFAETLAMLSPAVTVDLRSPDGATVARGDVAARVEGPTRALLTAERTARTPELAHTALRLTLGAPTTEAEIARVLELLAHVVERLRGRVGARR